ncbi:MAG TPA: flavodoxin domain-containing protein [Micromonosporaceae bacterium]
MIVYESLFGNTHEVAEAIGEGVRASDPSGEVSCLAVADAGPDLVAGADLLVVGGPTHMRGMSTSRSRTVGVRNAVEEGHEKPSEIEPGAEGEGIRDWFHTLPKATRTAEAAAFDTRAGSRLAGGAAHGIARRLRRHGYELAADPEGFVIEGTEGPLRTGEHDRARRWGADLFERASASVAARR